jgi:glycosyltransferase involved in cell wall biosynthesis
MSSTQAPFFSIVIPAHNEELYISETLESLHALKYPVDSFEVIVVENGSDDATLERARVSARSNMMVISVPVAGVSAARNTGASKINPNSDWVIFLDADTHMSPTFLNDITNFLEEKKEKEYVIGSVSLWPWPYTKIMTFWYFWSNFGMYIRKSAYAGFLIVKPELLRNNVSFDESVCVGEDLRFAVEARKQGNYFFMWTRKARTSTRRFTNGGWKKIPVWVGMWFFAMMVPIYVQRRFQYKVVR